MRKSKRGAGITINSDPKKPKPAKVPPEYIAESERKRKIEDSNDAQELRKTEKGNYE